MYCNYIIIIKIEEDLIYIVIQSTLGIRIKSIIVGLGLIPSWDIL